MSHIKKIYWLTYNKVTKLLCKLSPYGFGPALAKYEYRQIMGKKMNLKNPRNLIEKIIWMQFHTDTSLWTECADKYRVRKYIREKGLESILPKLYGHYENAEVIDFESLPDSFVLKTNNSCGQILIVRDKSKLDINEARRKLSSWLKESYGYNNAQLHYTRIKPCIIAEELLIDKSLKPGESLIDYKVWCFNGIPESILVVSERSGSDYYVSFFDLQWNNISEKVLDTDSPHYGDKDIAKPKNLEKMLEYATALSSGFPEVRVDFYDIDGIIHFGEMTFTTGYGYCTEKYYDYLGTKIDLTKIKKSDEKNNACFRDSSGSHKNGSIGKGIPKTSR